MGKKRFNTNTELLSNSYDDFFNKVYEDRDKYKDLSNNVFDRTETRRLDFDSHNQDELTGYENPFTSQFSNPNTEDPYNEYRANNQSGLEQIGKIIPRAINKAATEVAKLAPIIYGVGKAVFEDNETSALEDIFNNEGIKTLDEMNQKINTELLPVYVKDSVKNGTLMDNLLSTSFYATEGADGIGFMASMFAPGMILSKLSLGSKLIGGLSKVNKLTKMVEGTEGSVQVLKGLGWSGRAIDSKIAVLTNSMIESGAESKGTQDALKGERLNEIELYKSKGLSQEQAEEVFNQKHPDWDNQVASAMKGDFWMQMPMLLGTGSMMHKAIFGKALDKAEKTVEYGLKGRVGSMAKQWGKATLSEGFIEEAGQSTLENYYTKKAYEGKLGKGLIGDVNIGDLTKEYINTVSSVEGQKAIFLGALMGGPFMSMEARREHLKGLKDTNNITNGLKSSIDDYNTIKENDIYEKDPNDPTKPLFKRDENGNITNEKVVNREKALEVAKSLKNIEDDDALYDEAIKSDDVELQKFIQNRNILKLIAPAIQNGKLGLQILKEELEQTLKFTDISEADKSSKDEKNTNKKLVENILEKAKHLQEQNEKFKDFSPDIIKLEDPRTTKELNEEYLNHLNSKYIETKSLQYDAENNLKELNKKRDNILDELGLDKGLQIENELSVIKERSSSLLKQVSDKIRETEKEVNKYKKDINELWENKDLINKSFKSYINEKEKKQKQTSEENVQEIDEFMNLLNEKLSETDEFGENKLTQEEYEALLNGKTFFEQNKDILKNKVKQTVEERNKLNSEIFQVSKTIEYLEKLLKDTNSSIELNKILESINKLNSNNKKENLKKSKISDIKNSIKSEFEILNDILNRINELKENLNQYQQIEKDLNNKINYYKNLLLDPSFKDFSKSEINSKIKKIEKKKFTLQKLIKNLLESIRKAYFYIQEYVKITNKNINNLEKFKKENDFTILSSDELNSLIKSDNEKDKIKVSLYPKLKKEFDKLENDILNNLDNIELVEEVNDIENKRLSELNEKLSKYDNQIRYLKELLDENFKEVESNIIVEEDFSESEVIVDKTKAAIMELHKEKVEQLPTQAEKETKRDLNRSEQEGVDEKDISEDDSIYKEEDENVANSFTNSKEVIEPEPENNSLGHKIQNKITEALEKIYKIFEKTPRDKRDDKVTFSLGDFINNDTVKDIWNSFLKTGKIDKAGIKWLEEYLPIKVTLTNGKEEGSSFLKSKKGSPNFESYELPLRKSIVKALIENKGDFTKFEGSVQGQGKGKLNLDNVSTQNNVLDISVLKEMKKSELLKYLKENTYIVNHDKQLIHAETGQKSVDGFFNVIKSFHSGDVFLVFTRPNGQKVPIKLNNKRISEEKAGATVKLLSLLSNVIRTNQSDIILSDKDFKEFLKEKIGEESYSQLESEINLSKRDNNNSRLREILEYITYSQNNNEVSKLFIDNQGNLTVGRLLQKVNEDLQGEGSINYDMNLSSIGFTGFAGQNIDALINDELDENEQARFNHLVNFIRYKKSNIIASEFKNDSYVEHVFGIDNKEALVNTNVSVDKDIFQGYSDIFLNNEVTTLEDGKVKAKELKEIENTEIPLAKEVIYNEPTTSNQSEIEAKKADIERRRQEELTKIIQSIFPNTQLNEIVYHGTRTQDKFDTFDENKIGELDSGYFGRGFYFSPDKSYAEGYSKQYNGYTIAAILNLQNPLETDANKANTNISLENNDGAIVRAGENLSPELNTTEYDANEIGEVVVKNSNQIHILSEKELNNIDKINAEYDAELKALETENNLENTRIIENNFVSLSKMDNITKRSDKTALVEWAMNNNFDLKLDTLTNMFEQLKQQYSNNKDLNEEVKKICGL